MLCSPTDKLFEWQRFCSYLWSDHAAESGSASHFGSHRSLQRGDCGYCFARSGCWSFHTHPRMYGQFRKPLLCHSTGVSETSHMTWDIHSCHEEGFTKMLPLISWQKLCISSEFLTTNHYVALRRLLASIPPSHFRNKYAFRSCWPIECSTTNVCYSAGNEGKVTVSSKQEISKKAISAIWDLLEASVHRVGEAPDLGPEVQTGDQGSGHGEPPAHMCLQRCAKVIPMDKNSEACGGSSLLMVAFCNKRHPPPHPHPAPSPSQPHMSPFDN